MANQNSTVTSTDTPVVTLSRYAQRVAARRAKRLNPSPQALAARRRAAERNREMADLHQDRLDLLAAQGDPIGIKLELLAVML